MPHPRRLVAILVVVAVAGAACRDADDRSESTSTSTERAAATTAAPAEPARCGRVEQEEVDPAALNHLLPSEPEPVYLTDPPTSGPHDSRPLDSPVRTEPLTRPRQIGVLESGRILVQYRDLERSDVATLELLAGAEVVVAPNPDLPAPVVATAWVHKLSCTGVSARVIASIEQFTVDRFGAVDGGHRR